MAEYQPQKIPKPLRKGIYLFKHDQQTNRQKNVVTICVTYGWTERRTDKVNCRVASIIFKVCQREIFMNNIVPVYSAGMEVNPS